MVKLSNKVWVDPQRVVAIVRSHDDTHTIIHLDDREQIYINMSVDDIAKKIEDYRKIKMREFLKIKGVL